MPYMVTFTINIPQMLANIPYTPYMDPMGRTLKIFSDESSEVSIWITSRFHGFVGGHRKSSAETGA